MPVLRGRGKRPGTPAIAYSLALAVLGQENEAQEVVVGALRKGGRSRVGVIAHARRDALDRADDRRLTDVAGSVPADLRALALQLSGSRSALERAVVDLELRFDLDAPSFARVLGLSHDRARARSASVAEAWVEHLDSAMIAWLGPGSCPKLGSVLDVGGLGVDAFRPKTLAATGTDSAAQVISSSTSEPEASPSVTVGDLLSIAPAVHVHLQGCDVCAPRLRSLTPVRTLVGQRPIDEVPAGIAAVARSARPRVPQPLPPSIEPRRLELARWRTVAATLVVTALAIFGAAGVVRGLTTNEDDKADRVARLVEADPTSRLLGTPTVLTADTRTAALANNGTEPIRWRAQSSAPWLSLRPTSGRLLPAQTVSIGIDLRSPVPTEGAAVTITGDDGSRQILRYDAAR